VGKAVWLLLIVLVVVLVAYKAPELLNPETYLPEGEKFVELDVRMSESGVWSSSWASSSYSGNVTYSVYNLGNANASDVHVVLSVDEVVLEDFVLPSLTADDSFSDVASVLVNQGEVKLVTLNASCGNVSDFAAFRLCTSLERFSSNLQSGRLYVTPDDPLVLAALDLQSGRLYVTPDDPLVLAALDNITTSNLAPDWMELRDWVAKNVEYVSDNETHGVVEYWQFPNETLTLGTGDCEDFSILLCSLLRANGWTEDEAYVVIGVKDGMYHGWVRLNVDYIGWQSIEPQANALNTLVGDYLSLSGFQAMYMFNDKTFETL
jgi:predicted transglutaminase-like cysteine proteinase